MKIINVSKSYNQNCLFNNLNGQFGKGFYLIKGKSGSGKSTLLEILTKNSKPDSGEILIEEGESFSYLSQRHANLISDLSLNENLLCFYGKEALSSSRVKELAYILDFNSFTKKVCFLSGGEFKKAELIFVLFKDVSFYILDEPFKSLDISSVNNLIDWLNNESKTKGIIITNNQEGLLNLPNTNVIDLSSKTQKLESNPNKVKEKSLKKSKINKRILLKGLWNSSRLFYSLRAIFSIFSVVFFSLALAFMPLGNKDIKYSGIINSESYEKVACYPTFYPFSNFALLQKINDKDSSYQICLSSNDKSLLFVSVPEVKKEIVGIKSFSNLPLNKTSDGISVFDNTNSIVDCLPYTISDKEEYESEIKNLPPVLQDAYQDSNTNLFFISSSAVNELLTYGGLNALQDSTNHPLSSELSWLNFIGTNISGTYYLSLKSTDNKDDSAVSFILDDNDSCYLKVIDSKIKRISYFDSLYLDNDYGFDTIASDDGQYHISKGLLLNYLFLTNTNTITYNLVFFNKEKLLDSDNFFVPYTPISQGKDVQRRTYFLMLGIAFTFCFILSIIFIILQPQSEKKVSKEIKDLLKKSNQLSMFRIFCPFSIGYFLLQITIGLLVYLPGLKWADYIYLNESLPTGSLQSMDQIINSSFISKYYSSFNTATYTCSSFSFWFLLILVIVAIYSLLIAFRSKKND